MKKKYNPLHEHTVIKTIKAICDVGLTYKQNLVRSFYPQHTNTMNIHLETCIPGNPVIYQTPFPTDTML